MVEHLERDGERALLVEFSDETGATLALVGVDPDHLMLLHRSVRAA